jgi:hypothetical protein
LNKPLTNSTQERKLLNDLAGRFPQSHLITEPGILSNASSINRIILTPLHPARLLDLNGVF